LLFPTLLAQPEVSENPTYREFTVLASASFLLKHCGPFFTVYSYPCAEYILATMDRLR
jgi:hypothetical protein